MGEAPSAAVPPEELAGWLKDARQRTLAVAAGLSPEQLIGPHGQTYNPILWTLGHIGFFQERWAWCRLRGEPPLHPGLERIYDSFDIDPPLRWQVPLPDLESTRHYLADVLEHVLRRLHEGTGAGAADVAYAHRLVVFHEDMHAEAITYDRDALGYPPPALNGPGAAPLDAAALQAELRAVLGAGPLPGDVELPGSPAFWLGADPGEPFVFDNEKWAHPLRVAPFRIARAPVTNGGYAEFVENGGYREERHWSAAGWRWCGESPRHHPARWRRAGGGGWEVRRFERWEPLPPHQPVLHVNWHEAQAWCAWAGRRLPSEAK